MSSFSDRLKYLRELKGWSKAETARKLEVTGGAYSNWEYGNREPNFETLQKISNIFGISTLYLLEGEKTSADLDILNKGQAIDMPEWFKTMDNDSLDSAYQRSLELLNNRNLYDTDSIGALSNLYKLLDTLKEIEPSNPNLSKETKSFLTVLMQNLNYQIDTDPTISLNDFYNKVINETEYPK
ncbi:helix-turn-helix transcriptional regulator [Enterococcus asini]|uniref:helix-turn-helix domain-containing protein n=1 Tax=Enterococcus asini TaxID=57732 RepID=UPI00288C7C01|nr:helix-turn-helix transcriptional regulator [Enterococcus asini]MDT2756227.1 helix-turn-helix transcriptional regulator [Enterococcus asini]